MLVPKLCIMAVLLTVARALPAAAAPAETAAPTEPQEGAGQNTSSAAAGSNGFLEEIFDGVAEAVSSGALQPLADVAIKPLITAVGASLLDQIFSAAGDVISEWKKSKRHNVEARPMYIPNKGSFILVSYGWPAPEEAFQNVRLTNKDNHPLTADTDKNSTNKVMNDDDKDIDKNFKLSNFTSAVEYSTTENSINAEYLENENNTEQTTLSGTVLMSVPNTITSMSHDTIVNQINEVTTPNSIENLLNNTMVPDLLQENFTLDPALNFEITNEIERRNQPENENAAIYKRENSLKKLVNATDIITKVHNTTKTKCRSRDCRAGRIIKNLNITKETNDTKAIDVKTEGVAERKVIHLRNVYLVPVRGDLRWEGSYEDTGMIITEAVKAAVETRHQYERQQKNFEQRVADNFRFLADILASS